MTRDDSSSQLISPKMPVKVPVKAPVKALVKERVKEPEGKAEEYTSEGKENGMKKLYVLLLVMLMVSFTAGCGSKQTVLAGDEQETVLAFSEAKTDTLLAGMNANDYSMFSTDFDQDMLAKMTESQFATLKQDRDAKLGLYISRTVNNVVQVGDFYAVNYDAVFEKDNAVPVRLVFRIAEPHEVSGLWFGK